MLMGYVIVFFFIATIATLMMVCASFVFCLVLFFQLCLLSMRGYITCCALFYDFLFTTTLLSNFQSITHESLHHIHIIRSRETIV